MPPFIPRRMPPVAVGVCRAVHASLPLPDAGPTPGEDLSLADALSAQARLLADSVEAAAPGTMECVRVQSKLLRIS